MKKTTLKTLSILGAVALTSQFAGAADIDFYAASTQEGAFKMTSTTTNAPWSTPLSSGSWVDSVTWVGVEGGGSEGFIDMNNDREKFKAFNFGSTNDGKTLNVNISYNSGGLWFNSLNSNGVGGNLKFSTTKSSASVGGPVQHDIHLNSSTNNAFVVEIGSSVTFSMDNDTSISTIYNNEDGKKQGQIIIANGGKIESANRINIRSSTSVTENPLETTHRDIVINEGAVMTAKAIGFYGGVAITVDGNLNMTNTTIYESKFSAIINDIVLFDLGENGTISFGENINMGTSADVRIYNFRNEAVSIDSFYLGDIDQFSRWDGSKWVNDFSLVDGFLYATGAEVPEPSEWAAIFGAVALGFAIYRRRK